MLYVKNNGEVSRYHSSTNRKFFAKIRACSGEEYRVYIKYLDNSINSSLWETNKKRILQIARAFLE
jgi:hypothetical protein